MALLERITVDPAVCHGTPVIRGLRYPVASMLDYLAGGDSIDDLLTEFPDLERDDLLACIAFAAMAIKVGKPLPQWSGTVVPPEQLRREHLYEASGQEATERVRFNVQPGTVFGDLTREDIYDDER